MSNSHRFEVLLAPLQGHPHCASDHAHQLKDLLEMEKAFRGVEGLYASTYSGVVSLEEKIACYRKSMDLK